MTEKKKGFPFQFHRNIVVHVRINHGATSFFTLPNQTRDRKKGGAKLGR